MSNGKPKILHKSNAGVLGFYQGALNSGKRVKRVTSGSMDGKKLMSAKGSISADLEMIIKNLVIVQKTQLPKPGCGSREISRRLKRQQRKLA